MAGTSPAMTLDKWFNITNAFLVSQIRLRLESSPAAIDLSLLEPGVIGRASSVGRRKVPLLLEAVEVCSECRIEREEVPLLDRIQAGVRGYRSVARIQGA